MSAPDSVTGSATEEPALEPSADSALTSLSTQAARQLADHHQVRTADAGHHLTMAVEDAAVGGRQRRHLPGQPATAAPRGPGPGAVRAERRGRHQGDPRRPSRNCRSCAATPTPRSCKEIAGRFRVREVRAGQVLFEAGQPVTEAYLVVHGRLTRYTVGKYGEQEIIGVVTDGDQMGDEAIGRSDPLWLSSVRAETAGVRAGAALGRGQEFTDRAPSLAAHLAAYAERQQRRMNRKGEADVPMQAGHVGEPTLPGGFVDYELAPREYELSLTQTVLRVHSRVADLYNDPMDQTAAATPADHRGDPRAPGVGAGQQPGVRAAAQRRLRPAHQHLLRPAHPGRHGRTAVHAPQDPAVPRPPEGDRRLLPAVQQARPGAGHGERRRTRGARLARRPDLPVRQDPGQRRSTPASIIALRTGEADQGVVGLYQTGIPEEYQPGLNVRFMGIDGTAIIKLPGHRLLLAGDPRARRGRDPGERPARPDGRLTRSRGVPAARMSTPPNPPPPPFRLPGTARASPAPRGPGAADPSPASGTGPPPPPTREKAEEVDRRLEAWARGLDLFPPHWEGDFTGFQFGRAVVLQHPGAADLERLTVAGQAAAGREPRRQLLLRGGRGQGRVAPRPGRPR